MRHLPKWVRVIYIIITAIIAIGMVSLTFLY